MIQKAAIMAAGMGTRLKPITNHTPKPLVQIRKKTLISYTLDMLENINIKTVAVNVHHHADKLKKFLQQEQKNRKIKIIISDETELILNTGGGVKKMQNIFKGEKILVCNCDTIPVNHKKLSKDIQKMLQIFDQKIMDVLFIICHKNDMLCHDGTPDFSELNEQQKKLKILEMKNPQNQNLINAGIYIIKDNYLKQHENNCPFSITQYWQQSANEKKLFGYLYNGKFVDAGNIQGLKTANNIIK